MFIENAQTHLRLSTFVHAVVLLIFMHHHSDSAPPTRRRAQQFYIVRDRWHAGGPRAAFRTFARERATSRATNSRHRRLSRTTKAAVSRPDSRKRALAIWCTRNAMRQSAYRAAAWSCSRTLSQTNTAFSVSASGTSLFICVLGGGVCARTRTNCGRETETWTWSWELRPTLQSNFNFD